MKRHHRTKSTPLASYTFHVEQLSHEGRGIALYGNDPLHPVEKHGKKVFIRNALVGETVRVQLTQQHAKFEQGEMLEILGPVSSQRDTPFCPHYGQCGGCSMQHMHPDAQILLKQNVLRSHLEHFAQLQPESWLAPLLSSERHYRRKARIGVRMRKAKADKTASQLVMGFRAANSNHLVDVHHCPILVPELDQSLSEIRELLCSLKGGADIGHIELIDALPSPALLIRHTAPLAELDVDALKKYVMKKKWQLFLQPDSAASVHRIDTHDGQEALHYTFAQDNLKFNFEPSDFIQVNATVNEQMVNLACQLLDLKQGDSVLDLFCGLGNFSLALARRVGDRGRVVGVEASQSMVSRGTENAQNNRINNVTFYAQDLTKDFSQNVWAKQGFDALLIDPPRAGAAFVMQYLPNFGAKKIVYVSCDPATLARDAGILAQSGYVLKKAGVIDMFTHTGHVESIALFEKNQALND